MGLEFSGNGAADVKVERVDDVLRFSFHREGMLSLHHCDIHLKRPTAYVEWGAGVDFQARGATSLPLTPTDEL